MTRYLITSAGTSGVIPYTGRVAGLLRSVPREQGLFSGLLLRKDDGSRWDVLWTRGLARTWRYTSVQEVSNRGNRAQYSCGTTRLGAECEEVVLEVPVRVRM